MAIGRPAIETAGPGAVVEAAVAAWHRRRICRDDAESRQILGRGFDGIGCGLRIRQAAFGAPAAAASRCAAMRLAAGEAPASPGDGVAVRGRRLLCRSICRMRCVGGGIGRRARLCRLSIRAAILAVPLRLSAWLSGLGRLRGLTGLRGIESFGRSCATGQSAPRICELTAAVAVEPSVASRCRCKVGICDNDGGDRRRGIGGCRRRGCGWRGISAAAVASVSL